MKRLVLDTNILVSHWRRSRTGSLDDKTAEDAEGWARRLIELHDADAIATPVAIEFACGVASSHELELTRAYLGAFRSIDGGAISEADCREGRRLAEWVPPVSSPRDLGDCLIKAIANRRNYEVLSNDQGMPRSKSTQRSSEGKPRKRKRR